MTKAAGIDHAEFRLIGEFTPDSGYRLMRQAIEKLGERLPHAFIIANDTMAVGALRALNEADISVPQRVSVISFNDVAVAKFTTPRYRLCMQRPIRWVKLQLSCYRRA